MKKTKNPVSETRFRDALRLMKPYRGALLLSLVFTLLQAGLAVAAPLFFGKAVDFIVGAGQVGFEGVRRHLLTAGALALLSALGAAFAARENNRVANALVRDLRVRAFDKLQVLPLKYLDAVPAGDTLSKIVADVDQLSDGVLLFLTQFFSGVVTILGTLVILLTLSPTVAAAVFVLTPLSLFVSRFIARRIKKYFVSQSAERGALTAVAEETVTNLGTVRAFGMEEERKKAFNEKNEALGRVSLKAVFFSSLTNPATRFVNALVYAAVALTGALSVLGGTLSVGMLVSVLGYANQYTKPFNEISSVLAELTGALASAGRVLALLKEAEEAPDPVTGAPEEVRGEIEFDHVSFSYDPARPFIEDLCLKVGEGQTAALVGKTGCGKTTIINLLMRFYETQGGVITLDGVSTRAFPRRELRKKVGMVLQETWLKRATVFENLAFGVPDATREEVERAAKLTKADAFIKRLPEGYDTLLGEDGGALSAGEKQLLCITRALLTDPDVLILDEATSSLDLVSEIRVQRAFARLMQGRTCIVVAHRLSTIMHADVIAVMDEGRIVETGTHAGLLEKQGAYARLWEAMNA